MRRGFSIAPAVLMLVAPFWATSQALAQSVGVHVSETAEDKVLRIMVHPAAEPRPALKYQLMPKFLDRLPGNAAVHYGKVSAEQISFFGDRELQEKIAKWGRMPLEELPRDEVRQAGSEAILGSLRRGARSAYCDWQLPLREGNFFAMLIPEVQQLRTFARLLAAKARLQIAERQFDEAVETLQIGYALGRHAAEGETLVHALVGIAISNIMSRQVQELMQQPDAPNLYWALTMLPRPLISLREAVEAEMHAVHLSFLEFRDLEDTTRSPEYWRDSLHRFWREFAGFVGDSRMIGRPEVLAAVAIKGYPVAKRALIRQGLSAEEVEAMPVSQVVLLYTMQTYEELRDDIFKWFYVPYWEGREGADDAEQQLMRSQRELREIIPLGAMLLPAVGAAQSAVARTDREIAVLRTIEALRMYAAANEGRLPEKLSDLTVPVPIDAVTGKPFEYQLRDDTAVIEGPPLPGILLRLEIKVAR